MCAPILGSVTGPVQGDIQTVQVKRGDRDRIYAMKNELEDDKTYVHKTAILGDIFFISFKSLDMCFSILQALKDKGLSQKRSAKEVLFELSKMYIFLNCARRILPEILEK